MKKLVQLILFVVLFSSCNSKVKDTEVAKSNDVLLHKVTVDEVVQTTQYTYLYVAEKKETYWIAVMKGDYEKGEELFYFDGKVTLMENFHSKELDRDFDRILFISQVAKEKSHTAESALESQVSTGMTGSTGSAHSGQKESDEAIVGEIAPVEGGITIAELYQNQRSYANKKVLIKGQVMKVNNQIMGRNWVHLQDGTKYNEDYDLTITTQELVEVGETVVFEGKIALNKDFTSGYFYPVIMEEAELK